MPEGDTIKRTAENMARWLHGRVVTEATSRVPSADLGPVVGSTIVTIEARGKHLLVRFSSGHVLHTHMRMTGAWHLYRQGDRWRGPDWQARVILCCGDRVAVCFRAPVVEVLARADERSHHALSALGPDVLSPDFDVDQVVQRARSGRSTGVSIGELLLDQRVVAGIGNIYRCEALFVAGVDPFTPVEQLRDDEIRRIVVGGARLMRANVGPRSGIDRGFGGGPGRPWVYRRGGQACRRCGTAVRREALGDTPRSVYWCPTCQPAAKAGATAPPP